MLLEAATTVRAPASIEENARLRDSCWDRQPSSIVSNTVPDRRPDGDEAAL
jgi:hypothetical protein